VGRPQIQGSASANKPALVARRSISPGSSVTGRVEAGWRRPENRVQRPRLQRSPYQEHPPSLRALCSTAERRPRYKSILSEPPRQSRGVSYWNTSIATGNHGVQSRFERLCEGRNVKSRHLTDVDRCPFFHGERERRRFLNRWRGRRSDEVRRRTSDSLCESRHRDAQDLDCRHHCESSGRSNAGSVRPALLPMSQPFNPRFSRGR